MDVIYTIPLKTIDGKEADLSEYADKVMLIVNTASKCGFTGQYKGLQELYDKYMDKGFIVLGFPCNQFNHQEPGDESEISKFCELNYGVTFPMFSKIDVNGENAHPLFQELKRRAPGILGTEAVKWNFTKFLVAKPAGTIKRFASATSPGVIEKEIKTLL
jgi:glutathione peroxidase